MALLAMASLAFTASCKSKPSVGAKAAEEAEQAKGAANPDRLSLREAATGQLGCPTPLVVSGVEGALRFGCSKVGAPEGEFVGEYGQWYPSGIRAVIGYFDDHGKRTGQWQWLDDEGGTTATKLYKHGSEVPVPTKTFFLYVKIPEDIMPIARGEKYEEPLQKFIDRFFLQGVFPAARGIRAAQPLNSLRGSRGVAHPPTVSHRQIQRRWSCCHLMGV